MNETNIYFLNLDLGIKHTGIESSAALRSSLFINQLNHIPTIITYHYRSQLISEVNELRNKGKLSKKIPVINIYDYLQELQVVNDKELSLYDGQFKVSYVGSKSIQYLSENDSVKATVIYNQLNDRLHYIIHLYKGKRYRRDYYHEGGALSCTHFFDKDGQKVTREVFYRFDQTICVIKSHTYKEDGKRASTTFQMLDAKGRIVGIFDTDELFIEQVLQRFFSSKNEKSVLVVDRHRLYYKPALTLKRIYGADKIKVISAIHNLHAVNYKEKETCRINSHYAAVFEDLSRTDAVVVQTNIQKQDILERFQYPPHIYAIPHTYENRSTAIVQRKLQQAVYFARYAVDKKHELAIDAFAQVVKVLPEAEFHCYGSGARLAELKAMVKTLEMEKNIFLHNWCDDVAKEYESTALSIISSPSESFSLTIAESLAHGCPVVGFDVPYGPKELIQSDENGYLVPYQDTQMMADKIIQIMQDPKLQERLSDNARNSAIRYSEKVVGQLWLTLLQEIDAV